MVYHGARVHFDTGYYFHNGRVTSMDRYGNPHKDESSENRGRVEIVHLKEKA
jgi:hypothetical protein